MDSLQQLKEQLEVNGYFANPETVQAIRAASLLEKPLLVEGPPGAGKTAIAHALAKMHQVKLLRVQCYEGIDASQLLYDYHYAKQLLTISMVKSQLQDELRDKTLKEAVEHLEATNPFWGEGFLIKRPILQALRPEHGRRQVLLIDEVDKTEKDAEALLLEVLSEYSISIPEYGTVSATVKPIIVLTSNRSRDIGEALRRRCIYLYVDHPSKEQEIAILNTALPEADASYTHRVVEALHTVRKLPLKHIPSVAESIDVLRLLMAANGETAAWFSLIAKNPDDLSTIRKAAIEL